MRKKKSFNIIVLPIYIFTIVFVVAPLIYLIVLSFMSKSDTGWGVSAIFTIENYKNILKPVYLNTFLESFKLALTSTLLIVVIGYSFAYIMARLSAKWKKIMMMLIIIPFWTNALIRLNGWIIVFRSDGIFNKLLMALNIIEKPLKLLFSYPAVVLGMVYALLPLMILSCYSSIEKLDWSLVEAARDLGASKIKAFLTVTLKLTLPGLLSGVILVFIPSMGLFFISDILGGGKTMLVGNLINNQVYTDRNWPFAAALSVVLMILTSFLIWLYRKVTKMKDLEGLL